jgi:Protein of unknown function (DUF2794)
VQQSKQAGPRAAVFLIPFQLGRGLSQIRQQYDSIDEFVNGARLRQLCAAPNQGWSICLLPPPDSGAIIGIIAKGESMSLEPGDTDPSQGHGGEELQGSQSSTPANRVTFDRRELDRILRLYGRKVAAGEWRDYAIDFLRDRAVFSVFRRSSEVPIYRIEKSPKLARRQGAYSVISATGLIVRRGHELDRVLSSIDKSLRVVAG